MTLPWTTFLADAEGPILADGAMATALFRHGLVFGDSPEVWNNLHPDIVRAVHRTYLDAGAKILLTNTFGANRMRLKLHGLQELVRELNATAARVLLAEIDASGTSAYVAGDIGPSGEIMHPLGPLGFDEARDGFQEQAEALVTAGVDLIWIETMYDASEARAAVGGVRAVDASVPIILSFTFDTRGHTMMGLSPEEAVSLARELDVQACGGNCGTGPDELVDVIRKMRAVDPDMVLVAKSNAGVPVLRGTETAYPAEPDFMAHYSAELYEAGAKIIGGCCGNHAEHIEAIGKELARRS